jgi:hypothetical protein
VCEFSRQILLMRTADTECELVDRSQTVEVEPNSGIF